MAGKMKVPDDYNKVHERVQLFREEFPDGVIVTERNDLEDNIITFRAMVFRTVEEAQILGSLGLAASTGHSESEITGEKDVEKCETVAVGRALANLGYKIQKGIASAEEMESFEEAKSRKERRSKRRDEDEEGESRKSRRRESNEDEYDGDDSDYDDSEEQDNPPEREGRRKSRRQQASEKEESSSKGSRRERKSNRSQFK